MSTAIRDVVVKVRLEQEKAALFVPDMSAIKAEIKSVQDLLKQLKGEFAAPFSLPGVGPGGAGGSPGSRRRPSPTDSGEGGFTGPHLPTLDLDAASKEADKLTSHLKPLRSELHELLPPLQGVGVDLQKLADSEADKKFSALEKAQAKVRKSSLDVGEGLQKAGEGVFTMARGLVLLTTGSDEDLRKTLERLAMFQGVFDIFKGGFSIVQGLTKAYVNMREATVAQAVANNILAGSEVTLGAARRAGATVGGSAGAAGMNPANLKALGIRAAGGGGLFSGAGGIGTGLMGAAAPGAAILGIGAAGFGAIALGEYLVRGKSSLSLPDAPQTSPVADFAEQLRQQRETAQRRQAITDQQRNLRSLNDQMGMERQALAGFVPSVIRSARFRTDADADTFDAHGIRNIHGPDDLRVDTEKGLQAAENLLETNRESAFQLEQHIQHHKNILDIMRQQGQAKMDELRSAQSLLDLGRQQEQSARRGLESFSEQLGSLSPEQFGKLKRLRDKKASGKELSQKEEDELLSLTPAAGEFIRGQRVKRGEERGGADFFKGAGFDAGKVDELRTSFAEAQDKIVRAIEDAGNTDQIGDVMANYANAQAAKEQKQSQIIDGLLEQLKITTAKLDAQQAELDKAKKKLTGDKSR